MSERLPVRINAYRLAESGETLKGTLTSTRMARLNEVLAEGPLDITCELAFLKHGSTFILKGLITTEAVITCQRCLEPMQFAIDNSFELSLVQSEEEATRALSDSEPYLIMEDQLLELSNLLEDEVLLSLPGYPRHDSDCLPHDSGVVRLETNEIEEAANPFSVLEKLKK